MIIVKSIQILVRMGEFCSLRVQPSTNQVTTQMTGIVMMRFGSEIRNIGSDRVAVWVVSDDMKKKYQQSRA